jgi:hypothetical protein
MPPRTTGEIVIKILGALLVLAVAALLVYIIYPTAGRYLEYRALHAGERATATVLALRANPVAACQDWWLLGRWRRCEGVDYAYTVVRLEHAGGVYEQRYFPSRLVRPLDLEPGDRVRAVASGSRMLIDERAYGYLPLPSETLEADLWILVTFMLPLTFFWWMVNNLGRILFGED